MGRLVLLLGLIALVGAGRAHADDVALVGVGDSWRFQAALEELPPTWRQAAFDDQLWQKGDSGFGISYWGENTLLEGLFRGSGAIYFRKTFALSDPDSVRSLTLRCDWQGGFVAYLNGVEIARRNLPGLPGTPVAIETLASVRYAGTAEDMLVTDPRLWLQPGTNVLAIQAHPNQEDWLDIVLVPELLANFTRGPYLQSVLQDRATVLWRTPSPASGQVEFGRDESLGQAVAASSPAPAQEVTLTGLEPGRRYFYRVRSGSEPGAAVSPVYSFRTLPATGDLDLVLLGDSGAGSAAQFLVAQQMARQIAQVPADLIVHLGDVIYPNFSFGRTDTRCLSVYRGLLRTTPFYFTWGNHDLYAGPGPFLAAFRQPTNSVSAADHLAEGTRPEYFYSFDAGEVHFVVLFWPYSDQYAMKEGGAQWRWLSDDLAASRKPWKFLMLHHPVNTSGGHRFDDRNLNRIPDRLEVADRLMPLAARYGVQMIFSGHDHNYERFHPIQGTHTVVTGGGGIILYGLTEKDPNSAVFEPRWHFTSVQLRSDTLRMCAVDWEGRVFDAVEWRRTPGDSRDPDGDGLDAATETAMGTRPDDPDTDGDGLSDGWEFLRQQNPIVRDSDRAERRLAPFLAVPIPRPLAELAALPGTNGIIQLRWLAAPGYRPVIESAQHASHGWEANPRPDGGGGPHGSPQLLELPANAHQRFFRVRLIPE